MRSKKESASKLSRCIKAPIRVLCRARDMYVKSMSDYAGRVHCGASATTLPKSFSVNSSRVSEDEDLRALMRALSQRSQEEKVETTTTTTTTTTTATTGTTCAEVRRTTKGLPKSFSVAIGRIDEDQPCYFQEDFKVNSDVLVYPRSRSYALNNKRTGMLA